MLIRGDSLIELAKLEPNSVDAVVTDPPYGLSFMGKKWDYDVPSVELWREVFRVMKPGAHLLSFGGTRTYHRMVVAIEDAGFEIRDQVMWIYGSGFPKSHDVSKGIDKAAGKIRPRVAGGQGGVNKILGSRKPGEAISGEAIEWQGWGTALKPANEPIVLARKPISEKTVAANVLRWGVGALNVDACRIGTQSASKTAWESEPNHSSLPVDLVGETAKRGTSATVGSIATKRAGQTSSAKGNAIRAATSKMDMSCSHGSSRAARNISQTEFSDLNTESFGKNTSAKSHADTSFTTKTKTGKTTGLKTSNSCPDTRTQITTSENTRLAQSATPSMQSAHAPSGRWPSNCLFDESAAEMLDAQSWPHFCNGVGASRFFYVAKASKRERNAGLEQVAPTKSQGARPNSADPSGKFPDHDHRERGGNNHPTVKPIKLMEYLCRLITPPGGVILDPFMGSGSTGIAAKRLGFQFIGIEMNEEYIEIAKRRVEHARAPENEVEAPDEGQLEMSV